MASKPGKTNELWSELFQSENHLENQGIYQRRRPQQKTQEHTDALLNRAGSTGPSRVSFVPAHFEKKRISWNRSLSTRGRTSIAAGACIDIRPKQKQPRRRGKPAIPKRKVVQPTNFEQECKYFEEVDAFELLEESPSPKRSSTWTMGTQTENITTPNLCLRVRKWLISKTLNYNHEPSTTLSKILDSSSSALGTTQGKVLDASNLRLLNDSSFRSTTRLNSVHSISDKDLTNKGVTQGDRCSQSNDLLVTVKVESSEDICDAVRKLSFASTSSTLELAHVHPFATLLAVCGQQAPAKLLDVLSKYCVAASISKIGEGTYGEAFKAGNTVCKIVPIDGELKVNGEVQKRSEELLEEVVLSRTLNLLRRNEDDAQNICTTFIDTLDLKVCRGPYDPVLVKAWEDWDEKHGSENDHPKQFLENQCYVVFVLQHGGKDLESFVLFNYDEARSLLIQVTAALAVAEAAYEFEHRDLHWGNILLSRNDSVTLQFILEGKHIAVKTFGLSISIIDFTLSRINTGEDILFLDLSSDPYLFKGPKGDKQSETYRKMKEVTEDFWEGSFPRTNVLWLIYLVDTLLVKKSFERSSKDERELRSLKKRLDKYQSCKEVISDHFFTDLLLSDG